MSDFRCIEFDPLQKKIELGVRPFPPLRPNEVLIKVWGSPINPSDRLFCQGLYGTQAKNVIVPGFEGTGTVVKTGKGLLARRLLGKRVSGAVQGEDGFWAEYVKLSASQCVPLSASISNETAACALVNPLTALALFEPLRKKKASGLIQTAAASQLGRMVSRLCRKHSIPTIEIVHRKELVEKLMLDGSQIVLNSDDSQFQEKLTQQVHSLGIQYAIDAVGGKLTGQLIEAMPTQSEVVVYGVLSGQNCEVNPGELIFKDSVVRGFWLSFWLDKKNPLEKARLFYDLKRFLEIEGKTKVARTLSFSEAIEELRNPKGQDSIGKTLILPQI